MNGNYANGGKTYRLVLMAVFSAIIAVQNFGPMPGPGYIPVPGAPFVLTIIQATVIIGALCLDLTGATIIGGVWGVLSMVRAYYAPTPLEIQIFTNPLVSVVPRVFVGFFGALVYKGLGKLKFPRAMRLPAAGAVGSAVNTILVLAMIFLLYRTDGANMFGVDVNALLPALFGIVTSSGAAEAVVSAVIVTAVGIPVTRYADRKDGRRNA
jgi:uncharacterized membrane protein